MSTETTTDFADQFGQPRESSLEGLSGHQAFVNAFSIAYARRHGVIALNHNDTETLFVHDPRGLSVVDIIRRRTRVPFEVSPATESAILAAIDRVYSGQASEAALTLEEIDANSITERLREATESAGNEDLLDTEGRSPIIRLVNQLLLDAVKAGASDVHVQPYEDRVMVRQRIDGVLFDSFEIPKVIQEEVLARIKVLGKMNIAEKRLPQDGRATVTLGSTVVDLRIASLPTSHNERIVIRLLDKTSRLFTMGELGMPDTELDTFRELSSRDHGMILVTGPTGSGKSTTLYGILSEINSHDLNVLTLEDPIEYQLRGISQTQINEKKGMTFASGMRSVLRQDPDIIMVGEIRDSETAMMAIQASLTGHLVFSTLHTNDAASAITRLLDLGIEPYLVGSSLAASLAQRLVRKLCVSCRQPDPDARLPEGTQTKDGNPPTIFRAEGCDECRGTGYRGRIGLFELLVLDDQIRDLVASRSAASEIRAAGIHQGMRLLATDGVMKVANGMTTMDEVMRVTTIEKG